MTAIADFRPIKKRRKVNLDLLGHVTRQMQGLIDGHEDKTDLNESEQAFLGLVEQWHGMLMTALVEEAKKH